MKIFLLPFSEVSPEEISALSATVPPERLAEAARCRRAEAEMAKILGFCLVRFGLATEGVKKFEPWIAGKFGKPAIPGNTVFFSLTHTDLAVAVAVAQTEIGIDLERIRPLRRALTERFCSPEELHLIDSSDDPDERAIAFWTKKEAEAKRTGIGIGQDLRRLDLSRSATESIRIDGVLHCLSLSPCDRLPEPEIVSGRDLM